MNCEKLRRIAKIGNGLASDARALAGSAGRVCLWTGIGIGVAGLVVVLIAKGNIRIEQARWRQRKGGEA